MIVHVRGNFDASAARALRAQLTEFKDCDLVLDFTGVQTFSDLAISILTSDLDARRVRVEGLPRHQERVFRYFGFTSATPSLSREYWRPEEIRVP